jgi:hypothetical protein
MLRLPASPRVRRRLKWQGAVVTLLVAVAAVVLLMPGRTPPSSAPTRNEGPARLASDTPQVRITKADRRAIDATLDRFLPAAMGRRDATLAWSLAGPELRAGSTLADWRAGSSPVPAYPLRAGTFHDWQTIDTGPRYVIFNLLVHPRPHETIAPTVFSGEVVKSRERWLVNRIYTIAIMNPITRKTHEVGPADFAAPGSKSQPAGKQVIGNLGILPIVGILALVLLIPLTLGLLALVRARRWRRRVKDTGRTDLPPLPAGYGAETREKTGSSRR